MVGPDIAVMTLARERSCFVKTGIVDLNLRSSRDRINQDALSTFKVGMSFGMKNK